MGHASPNQALEPTPYSLRLAPAFGRGSLPALYAPVNRANRAFPVKRYEE
jgi:hypothetical protein